MRLWLVLRLCGVGCGISCLVLSFCRLFMTTNVVACFICPVGGGWVFGL